MGASIASDELQAEIGGPRPPLVIDVRRPPAFLESGYMIAGALRRDHQRAAEWAKSLPAAQSVVVYCVHGHEVSQNACKALTAAGIAARYLEGGVEHWREAGGALAAKPRGASTRWVTRERPKIDRIACPWLIRRFIDPEAELLYVPAAEVRRVAAQREAVPYDVPDVALSHAGERCSFDAFVEAYRLQDPALRELATIVRGADTGRLELAPQSAGLAAVSLGLSRLFADDHRMLEHGMTLYDALYAWCRDGKDEKHTWNPEAYR
jgi:rhodanese-related sulfurtransferase